jgi:hypothetical protein
MRDDLNLAIASLCDLDGVAQVTDAAIDLDPVVQELLEGRDVEDLIVDGLRGVDEKLFSLELLVKEEEEKNPHCSYCAVDRQYGGENIYIYATFFVTFCCFPFAVRAYSIVPNPGLAYCSYMLKGIPWRKSLPELGKTFPRAEQQSGFLAWTYGVGNHSGDEDEDLRRRKD